MQTATRKPSVKLVGGLATTTSLKIAEAFGKQHKDVLRSVANLQCSPEFAERNFAPGEYIDAQNQKRPMYTITRDGFAFLASGFTGKEAAQWKEKYIAAFNELERRALEKAAAKRLPRHPAQPAALPSVPHLDRDTQHRINKRAWQLAQAAYEEFRERMQRDMMVQGGRTQPDDWQPAEARRDVLQEIEVAAHLMEAHAKVLRNRGRRLAVLSEQDYDRVVAPYTGLVR